MAAVNNSKTVMERKNIQIPTRRQIRCITDELILQSDRRPETVLHTPVIVRHLSTEPSILMFIRNQKKEFSLIHTTFNNIILFDFVHP